MDGTYTKLKDGSWGVRVQGAASAGAVVTVTKKDGSTKQETVSRVLWQGDGLSLCTIRTTERKSGGCGCDESCCRPRCSCDYTCNCRGGYIYDC
jgi:hypothetical protein